MLIWNIALLVINVMLFILIASKYTQFNNVYQENLRVQHGIEDLAERNSQLVNVILDELEDRLAEARNVVAEIDSRIYSKPPPMSFDNLPRTYEAPIEVKNQLTSQATRPQTAYLEEKIDLNDTNIPTSSKVIYMRQMGMSVQDIAQRLNLSQGEIALKLNLQAKQDSPKLRIKSFR